MNSFNLVISSAEKSVYRGRAVYCRVITSSGAMGIEARHEPLLAVLTKDSSVDYETESGDEKSLSIDTAVLSFKDNTCTIAADIKK